VRERERGRCSRWERWLVCTRLHSSALARDVERECAPTRPARGGEWPGLCHTVLIGASGHQATSRSWRRKSKGQGRGPDPPIRSVRRAVCGVRCAELVSAQRGSAKRESICARCAARGVRSSYPRSADPWARGVRRAAARRALRRLRPAEACGARIRAARIHVRAADSGVRAVRSRSELVRAAPIGWRAADAGVRSRTDLDVRGVRSRASFICAARMAGRDGGNPGVRSRAGSYPRSADWCRAADSLACGAERGRVRTARIGVARRTLACGAGRAELNRALSAQRGLAGAGRTLTSEANGACSPSADRGTLACGAERALAARRGSVVARRTLASEPCGLARKDQWSSLELGSRNREGIVPVQCGGELCRSSRVWPPVVRRPSGLGSAERGSDAGFRRRAEQYPRSADWRSRARLEAIVAAVKNTFTKRSRLRSNRPIQLSGRRETGRSRY